MFTFTNFEIQPYSSWREWAEAVTLFVLLWTVMMLSMVAERPGKTKD